MSWINKLSPPHIQDLVPYASAGRTFQAGEVWLNANENPLEKKSAGLESALNRYPQFQPNSLLDAYATYSGCSAKNLIVTRGIDEGIDLLLRAFCEYGRDVIVYTPPTYGMYSISAESMNIVIAPIQLKSDNQLDMEAFERTYGPDLSRGSVAGSYPKIVFLCSPNNPTGNVLNREDVLKVLELARGKSLVVLDEAYIEFSPEASFMNEIDKHDNLVVARTLSKAFGLAGLRTGFLAATPAIIKVLQKVSAPYPIPGPVVEIANTALSRMGITAMQDEVIFLRQQREALKTELEGLSFVERVLPGNANFLLMKVNDASDLMTFLKSRGVIIRDQSAQVGLENCVRITMGTEAEHALLVSALKAYGESS